MKVAFDTVFAVEALCVGGVGRGSRGATASHRKSPAPLIGNHNGEKGPLYDQLLLEASFCKSIVYPPCQGTYHPLPGNLAPYRGNPGNTPGCGKGSSGHFLVNCPHYC